MTNVIIGNDELLNFSMVFGFYLHIAVIYKFIYYIMMHIKPKI